MATGESKMSNWDVVNDIQDGDTVPILRNGKNYMSEGLAELNADLTYKMYSAVSQISSSLSTSSTLAEVGAAMPNYSILIGTNATCDITTGMDNGSYVSAFILYRINASRIWAEGYRCYASQTLAQTRAFYAASDGTTFFGWREYAFTDANTTSALNGEADEMDD